MACTRRQGGERGRRRATGGTDLRSARLAEWALADAHVDPCAVGQVAAGVWALAQDVVLEPCAGGPLGDGARPAVMRPEVLLRPCQCLADHVWNHAWRLGRWRRRRRRRWWRRRWRRWWGRWRWWRR